MNPPPLNHVFVDYENVHVLDLEVIGRKGVRFTLLLGSHEKKLDVELVERLFAHADSVELVRLTAPGRNALDFTLAYYLGRAVASDPTGHFHIISGDTGYDPMVKHLLSRNIKVWRRDDFSKLLLSGPPKPKPPTPNGTAFPISADLQGAEIREPFTMVLRHLRKLPKNRPKTRKTLANSIAGYMGKQSTRSEIEKEIDELKKSGLIAIDAKGTVTYTLERSYDGEQAVEDGLSDSEDCDIPF